MKSGMRVSYHHELNKEGFGSKFRERYRYDRHLKKAKSKTAETLSIYNQSEDI